MIKRLCLALALAFAACGSATAQPTPIGSRFLVAAGSGEDILDLQIATVPLTTRFVVVWTLGHNRCPQRWCPVGNIYARIFNYNGSARTAAFQVNPVEDNPLFLHDKPVVAGLYNGGFVVVWEAQGEDTNGFGIFGQRYDDSGVQFRGGEFRVSTHVARNQVSPSIAPLSTGGYVVLWASDHVMQSTYQNYARIFDMNSTPVGEEIQLSHHPVEAINCGNVTGLFSGGFGVPRGFVATWMEIVAKNEQNFVGQHYSSSGKLLGKPFTIDTHVRCLDRTRQSGIGRKVVALQGFAAVWPRSRDTRLQAQRYTSTDLPNGSQITVADNGQAPDVSVAAMPDGGFLVNWTHQGMFGRRYSATGVADGAAFEINQPAVGLLPRTAGLSNGNFVVVWLGQVDAADCDADNGFICPNKIYGALYSP